MARSSASESDWVEPSTFAIETMFARGKHRGFVTCNELNTVLPPDKVSSEQIEDESAVRPLDAAIQANLRETTTRVLQTLTPREERILRMRFGIGVSSDHTLEQVGQQFSVTRERIRQIEAKAIRKLKHPSRSRKLRSFLDT